MKSIVTDEDLDLYLLIAGVSDDVDDDDDEDAKDGNG